MYKKRLAFYGLLIGSVTLTLAIFLFILDTNNIDGSVTVFDEVLYYSKFFWFAGALVAISNFIGLLVFGIPDDINRKNIKALTENGWDKNKKLIVVYVSKGDNYIALERSIITTGRLLERYHINHRIDVVTDSEVENKHSHGIAVVYHVVPDQYATKGGSRYKARALHFVVEKHAEEELHAKDTKTWVLHLDEESQLHESALAGIHTFISNPANANAVGQGEIKYNAHQYGKNILITAMDAVRTGDDLGRFRFQYKVFKKPLFGMHGSFILIPGKLEQIYGFDLGGKGSITEDAYFALKCASEGHDFKWVDGFIQEQSPYSISAIVKQRRRWYCGLMYLAFDGRVKFTSRAAMMLNMLLWTVAWVGPIVTLANLMFGGYFPLLLIICAALIQGFYVSVYMVGLWHNLEDTAISSPKRIFMFIATFVLVPVVNAIEGFSVLYGILKPVKHFDVVHKN
jgi:egghead protein (zeste-white 4 protein)